jgi:hypothetical protein
MIISDLNFCEIVEVPNTIIGGASVLTDGDAIAGPGYAIGYATADAFGDSTSTNAQVSLSVVKKKFITISKAKIEADALAEDTNGDKVKAKLFDFDLNISRN